jgi:hypothetical protein
MCERCEIKFAYGKKIVQKKLQFNGVYVQTLFLYICGIGDISIWVPFMA